MLVCEVCESLKCCMGLGNMLWELLETHAFLKARTSILKQGWVS